MQKDQKLRNNTKMLEAKEQHINKRLKVEEQRNTKGSRGATTT
jgi:hypothetical protein